MQRHFSTDVLECFHLEVRLGVSPKLEHEFLDADLLKDLLTQRLGPKLVILNSCRGAQAQSSDRFASTAETLVRGGSIAAVVAMQFDISDIMGTAFSPAFFSNLMYTCLFSTRCISPGSIFVDRDSPNGFRRFSICKIRMAWWCRLARPQPEVRKCRILHKWFSP